MVTNRAMSAQLTAALSRGQAVAEGTPPPTPRLLEPQVTASPESLRTLATSSTSPAHPTAATPPTEQPAAPAGAAPASADSETATSAHDHTYSTSGDTTVPQGSQSQTTAGANGRVDPPGTPGGGSSSASGTDGEPGGGQRPNSELVLLQRHITQMQRICRASMADCAVSRHRRQIIRLQSIRRMLEDLQRQIRSLRNASFEDISRYKEL